MARSELFDPARHEPLREHAWDAKKARAGAAFLARAVLGDRTRDGHWDLHPLDEDSGGVVHPHHGLYLGAAGNWLGLARLANEGILDAIDDLDYQLHKTHERYLEAPDAGEDLPSWMVGESGVIAARLALGRDELLLDMLASRVLDNASGRERELLFGSPGTALGAALVLHAVGEHEALRRSAVACCNRLLDDAVVRKGGAHWVQRLGDARVNLGAAHGLAGVLLALAQCARVSLIVDEVRWNDLAARGRRTFLEHARVEPDLCNWPTAIDSEEMLVQWCHGAPGIVLALTSAFPDRCEDDFEQMLWDAGELIWRAGPLKKGPGLCHGTSGNGRAFLRLYERTGETGWLERARLFALHALEQAEDALERYERARPSLFTGDVGTALFLHDCIEGRTVIPGLDVLIDG